MSANEALGPLSIESEQTVLGSVLIDSSAWDRLGDLSPEHFANAAHGAIFAAARAGWMNGDAADLVLVGQRLRDEGNLDRVGGLQYLGQLANVVPTTLNVGTYAKIIVNRAQLRGLIAAGAEISDMARDPTIEPSVAIEQALGTIAALADGKHHGGMVPFGQVVGEAVARAITGNRKLFHNMFPIKALETKFGPLEPGNLIALAGRPSMGKTVAGLQAALLAARAGHHTAVFELEMTDISLANRALAAWSDVPLSAIKHGDVSRYADRLRAAQAKLEKLPIQLNTTPGLHVDSLRAQCRAMSRRNPLALIVVDHLTLLRGEGRDKRLEVGYCSNTLKIIAKENNAVVIALVQLNRQVEGQSNKRPGLKDLGESGNIEQDCDGVVMIYRDDYYNKNSEDKGYVEFIIAKNRDGETGTECGRHNFPVSRIDDAEPGYRPSQNQPERKGAAFVRDTPF
jgi:replicative DNA helicase